MNEKMMDRLTRTGGFNNVLLGRLHKLSKWAFKLLETLPGEADRFYAEC